MIVRNEPLCCLIHMTRMSYITHLTSVLPSYINLHLIVESLSMITHQITCEEFASGKLSV